MQHSEKSDMSKYDQFCPDTAELRENMSIQVPYILKFSGDLMLLKIIHLLLQQIQGIINQF